MKPSKSKPFVAAECLIDTTPTLDQLHESRTLAELKDMAHLLNLATDHDSLRRALDVALPRVLLALDEGRIEAKDAQADTMLMGLLLVALEFLLDGLFAAKVTRH